MQIKSPKIGLLALGLALVGIVGLIVIALNARTIADMIEGVPVIQPPRWFGVPSWIVDGVDV